LTHNESENFGDANGISSDGGNGGGNKQSPRQIDHHEQQEDRVSSVLLQQDDVKPTISFSSGAFDPQSFAQGHNSKSF
jgi:hypothetical protein